MDSTILQKSELSAEKAKETLLALNREAESNGTSKMSLEEINAEIDEVRKSRQKGK